MHTLANLFLPLPNCNASFVLAKTQFSASYVRFADLLNFDMCLGAACASGWLHVNIRADSMIPEDNAPVPGRI